MSLGAERRRRCGAVQLRKGLNWRVVRDGQVGIASIELSRGERKRAAAALHGELFGSRALGRVAVPLSLGLK